MQKITWTNSEAKQPDFDEIVLCVKKTLDVEFPDKYLQCAKEHGGGSPSPSRFDTGEKKSLRVKALLSLDPRSSLFIWFYYTMLRYMPKYFLPVALDNDDNFICLNYEFGYPPSVVYYKWDVHGPISETNIAKSFGDFLEMLY